MQEFAIKAKLALAGGAVTRLADETAVYCDLDGFVVLWYLPNLFPPATNVSSEQLWNKHDTKRVIGQETLMTNHYDLVDVEPSPFRRERYEAGPDAYLFNPNGRFGCGVVHLAPYARRTGDEVCHENLKTGTTDILHVQAGI